MIFIVEVALLCIPIPGPAPCLLASPHCFIFTLAVNSSMWWRAISHFSCWREGMQVVWASWKVLQQEPLWRC